MPVAKSYANLKQIGEPFKTNGRMYVTIITEKGSQKAVRWYSEAEYARMYPEAKVDKTKNPYYKSQKLTLGFDKGYITIFKGVTPENEYWFEENKDCRYAKWWGWYVPSTIAVPTDYPKGIETVKLEWEPMDNGNEWLKSEKEVLEYVRKTLLAAIKKSSISQPQGKIGDRLTLKLKVIGKQTEVNNYGETHTYEMKDEKDNLYKWRTQAQDWSVGTTHKIRGTVKEYGTIDDEIATILTRCMEVR